MTIRDATLADAPAIARIYINRWLATYRGLLPNRLLADLSYAGRNRQWAWAISAVGEGDGYVVVAEDAGAGIVGFASGGRCQGDWPFTGEPTANYLVAQGHRSLLLWVLSTNAPGRVFYEALGGALIGKKTEEFAEATLHEVAHGWPDLALLQQQTRHKI